MAIEIRVPRLGWTMEQGTFGGWLKKDGEAVKEGMPLFTVEGDKALQEVEAIGDGVLRIAPQCPEPGATVDVGALLGYLVAPKEEGAFPGLPSDARTAAGEPGATAALPPTVPETPTTVAAAATDAPGSPTILPATPTMEPGTPAGVPGTSTVEPGTSRTAAVTPTTLPGTPTTLPGTPTTLPGTPTTLPGTPPAAAASAGAALPDAPNQGLAPSPEQTPGGAAAPAASPAFLEAAALRPSVVPGPAVPPGPSGGTPSCSPRALRLAAELGVDWTRVRSSSRSGRIVERDIRAAAQSSAPERKSIPLTPVRKIIAERMHEGATSTASVTLAVEADATELVALRDRLKKASASESAPTFTDILVVLVAKTLALHPFLNARLEGGEIVLEDAIHMGIAVDAPDGLVVPVLRDAGRKSLLDVARETKALIEKARARRLAPEEMHGGTFTLTNLGMCAVDAFTPILNLPQCAILGVGRIARKPAVHGDAVVPRHRVTLSLTFDHRVVDGAPAARFLTAIVERLQSASAGIEG